MGGPLKVGVIGLGTWGEKHLQVLKGTAGVEVVAVCDTGQDRLKALAARYGVSRSYTSFSEMLANERLDAVHVVTPEPAHREPVVQASSKGIHVLVEKPMATNLEDADAMIRASETNKTILMVGHILRWDTRYAMVKESIESGGFGKIASIFARRSVNRAQAPTFLSRSTPVMQLGIHDIDIILWYKRSKVRRAYCRSSRILDFKHPDNTTSTLEFEDGSFAVVYNSFSLPDSVPAFVGARMEVLGEKSFTIIDMSEQGLFVSDDKGYRTPDTTLIPVVRGELGGTLRQEIEYFARCVASGKQPEIIRPEESREALRVARACESSMADGRPVELD
ncbi:MAG: Gfo/Idh/MocA family oxidoreductase [Nitrososphaerota archaeon]|nr:Gfo/Idh/MocA family oxidoreductase [Nitrososphaerota archaeon]